MDSVFEHTITITIDPPPPPTPDEMENLTLWRLEQHRLAVLTSGEPDTYPPNIWDKHWQHNRPGRQYFNKK